jgi:hypothetical protein
VRPSNKRDDERIQILGELRGEVMVYEPMTITEVSYGGAQIESAFPLQLNSLHDFRLTLGERSVVVKARVAHCSVADIGQETVVYRSGIEYIDLPGPVEDAIADFIQAIRDGRRAL